MLVTQSYRTTHTSRHTSAELLTPHRKRRSVTSFSLSVSPHPTTWSSNSHVVSVFTWYHVLKHVHYAHIIAKGRYPYHIQPTSYLPWYRTHTTWAISSPLGEYSTHVIQVCRQLEPLSHNSRPPGTHHCSLGRGGMEWEVCLMLLHMTNSGNQTPDILISSPVPSPLGYMLHIGVYWQKITTLRSNDVCYCYIYILWYPPTRGK